MNPHGFPLHDPGSDPRGLRLLSGRLDRIPDVLEGFGAAWNPGRAGRPPVRRVVATGIGSSEAHARYLVGALNRLTRIPAEFVPLGSFASSEARGAEDRTLVLFSQGLSANARIALDTRHRFAHRVVFTASTPGGLRNGGKPDRAALLEGLVDAGAEVVRFPLEDEYTVLIRVVGPVLGFLAARLWVEELRGPGAEVDAGTWGRRAAKAYRIGTASGAALSRSLPPQGFPTGLVLPVSPDLLDWSQNLGCKFVEGLYQPAPATMDLLQFAHGPFQQLNQGPRPVWVLHRETPGESDLAGRIATMCRGVRLPWIQATAGLVSETDLLPIEAEGLFNAALFPWMETLGVDQVSWPGKGLDGPLYGYTGPAA